MSSTASSAKICVECASMSAREGSIRNREGCRVERRMCAYDRSRERRSSPPHEVPDPATCAGGGGYVEAPLTRGRDGEGRVKERDSSS